MPINIQNPLVEWMLTPLQNGNPPQPSGASAQVPIIYPACGGSHGEPAPVAQGQPAEPSPGHVPGLFWSSAIWKRRKRKRKWGRWGGEPRRLKRESAGRWADETGQSS